MTYQKPTVTIELAEYLALTRRPVIEGTTLTEEEYRACTTAVVVVAIRTPELVNRPPAEGLILNTYLGNYRAEIIKVATAKGATQQFLFTKLDTNGS